MYEKSSGKIEQRIDESDEFDTVPVKMAILTKILNILDFAGWFLTIALTISWLLGFDFVKSMKITVLILLVCLLYYFARYLIIWLPIVALLGYSLIFGD